MSKAPRWSGVTALFGGAFDPPHLGHRAAASGLFARPGIRRVRIVPTGASTLKSNHASAEHRLAMARLAFGRSTADLGFPHQDVEVDDREIRRIDKPSYTFDLLQEMRGEIGPCAFVIGTDQLNDLHRWHRFPEVLGLSHWIVLLRKAGPASGAEGRRKLAELEASGLLTRVSEWEWQIKPGAMWLACVETEAPACSSTSIREEIARTGRPPDGIVLPEIAAYLKRFRLYGTSGDENGQKHSV